MVIKETILVHATIEKTWDTFTDLACWSDWNTVISNVRAKEKRLCHGNSLRCVFRPFFFPVDVNISIENVVRHELVVWTAKKKGLFARHEFIFKKHEDGVTVTSSEEFSGLLSLASGALLPRRKMRSLTKKFLQEMKKASEATAGEVS